MGSRFTCTAWSLPTMEESRSARRSSRTKCCEEGTDMCLAIPGKVVEAFDQQGMRMAKVQFGGVVREACPEFHASRRQQRTVARVRPHGARYFAGCDVGQRWRSEDDEQPRGGRNQHPRR